MTSLASVVQTWSAYALSYILHQWDAIVYSGFPIFFWVNPRWSSEDIPDQTGRVVLVTGGNSGTGYATSKMLYEKGATIYLACRDVRKGQEAVEAIKRGGDISLRGMVYPNKPKAKGNGKLECLELDLADLHSVERFAEEFQKREAKLDVLFANAGVMASPEGLFTKQGYTLQFGTNCLGHHRLITLLLPLLLRTSHSHPSSPSRIITTSSTGHSAAPRGGVDFRSVVRDGGGPVSPDEMPKRGKYEYGKWVEYGQSKWGNIAIARWLHWVYGPQTGRRKEAIHAEKAGEGEVISIAVHPGCIATNLAQHLALTPYIIKYTPWLAPLITKTPNDGASNQIWAATCTDEKARELSGEYIVPFQRIERARPDLDDKAKVEAVWDWCEAQGRRYTSAG